MKIQRAYKTELDPNNVQRTLLAKHAGTARFVYNWGLARRIAEYEATGKSSNFYEQNNQLNAIKREEFPWMLEVSSRAAVCALYNLNQAFQNFFRRCKQGGKPGFPRFKSKSHGLGSFRLTDYCRIEIHRIKLPKLGWIRLKESDYLPTSGVKVNSVTVSEKAGHWFASVQVEEEIDVPENQGPSIGLDLGLTNLVVGSDGSKLEAPKFLKRSMKRMRRLSRRHSKKQKGSKNRKKSAMKLAKLHQRIANQRKDYIHKATTKLAKTKSVIVVEDLNVKGMVKNHSLARSIVDAGWSELVRQLEYKTVWYGSRLIKADRFFPSTKRCCCCGSLQEMSLGDRTYWCDACGMVMDRDVNAACNLLTQVPPVRRKLKPVETTGCSGMRSRNRT